MKNSKMDTREDKVLKNHVHVNEAMDPFPFDDERNRWVLGYDNSPEVLARWVQLKKKMHAEFMASLQQ